MAKIMRVTMPDGSKWEVPVNTIAQNKAENCGRVSPDSWVGNSDSELIEWASKYMPVNDIFRVMRKVEDGMDLVEGWMKGTKEIVER